MGHALIVDDDLDSASTLLALVAAERFTVAVAHTLRDARRRIALQQPDIVLLDLQLPDGTGMALEAVFQARHDAAFLDIGMPGLNGYELAAKIRSQAWGRDVLLVATTGWGQDDDKRRALVAGFDVHLTKPLVLDAATRLLAERLGSAPLAVPADAAGA